MESHWLRVEWKNRSFFLLFLSSILARSTNKSSAKWYFFFDRFFLNFREGGKWTGSSDFCFFYWFYLPNTYLTYNQWTSDKENHLSSLKIFYDVNRQFELENRTQDVDYQPTNHTFIRGPRWSRDIFFKTAWLKWMWQEWLIDSYHGFSFPNPTAAREMGKIIP